MFRIAIAAVFILLTGGFVAAFLAAPPKLSGDWAAWVQGAGTIVAIVASVGIVGWQSHRDREKALAEARAERFRYLDAALEVVGGIAQVSKKIATNEVPHTPENFNAMRSELGVLAEALGSIEVTRLDGHNVTESVLVSLGAARLLLHSIESVEHTRFDRTSMMGWLRGEAKEVAVIVDSRAKLIGEAWRKAKGEL